MAGKTPIPDRLVPRTGDLVDRRDLTDPTEIVERMARDILAARREAARVLIAAGWPMRLIARFGLDAQDLAMTPAFLTQDAVDQRRAAELETTLADRLAAEALAAPRAEASTGDMVTMLDDLELTGDAA